MVRYADILLMYAEAQTEYLNKAQGASIINDELVYSRLKWYVSAQDLILIL